MLGRGVAGSLAVAAARAAGLRTIAVERHDADRRSGVPHATQLHNLLGRGQRELARLLPGLAAELDAAGIVEGRVASESRVFDAGTLALERDLDRRIWSFPLADLDAWIRSRPEASPDELLEGRVAGLELDDGRCAAARVELPGGDTVVVEGLVVDALGANSPVPEWLGAAGLPVPRTIEPVDQWYATAEVRGGTAANRFLMVFPGAAETRGALASPRAGGGHVVSLNGVGAFDAPPRTPAEFAAFARSLPDAAIAELLESGEVGRLRLYRRARAAWNRYDERSVDGLVAIGDASASLNPLHGQGVSAAAWEARLLGEAWLRSPRADGYPVAAGRVRAATWDLMTLRSPARADAPTRDEWAAIDGFAARDPAAHAALVDVWHMVAPVSTLRDLAAGRLPDPADDPLWR